MSIVAKPSTENHHSSNRIFDKERWSNQNVIQSLDEEEINQRCSCQ